MESEPPRTVVEMLLVFRYRNARPTCLLRLLVTYLTHRNEIHDKRCIEG